MRKGHDYVWKRAAVINTSFLGSSMNNSRLPLCPPSSAVSTEEGASQPAQGEMPPPPARLGQGRRYQGINPPPGDPMFGGLSMTGLGRVPMQFGANATGAGGQADAGSLR